MWKLSTFISIFLQAFDWFFNFLFYTGVINNVVLISGVEQNDSVIRIYVSVKWKPPSHVWLFPTPWIIQSVEFSRPEYWSGWPFLSPGVLPNPGMEPRSSTLQVDSLPAEPRGKPKNTGVGSLSLLQGIFLTQEWNRGLLHCKQILYELSYEGSLKADYTC